LSPWHRGHSYWGTPIVCRRSPGPATSDGGDDRLVGAYSAEADKRPRGHPGMAEDEKDDDDESDDEVDGGRGRSDEMR
jgi:hypothetical protein